MDDATLLQLAKAVLTGAEARALKFAAAESCTGGLIAATLARVPGASNVLERGFVTYSNEAKTELLGVPVELIARRGVYARLIEHQSRGVRERISA